MGELPWHIPKRSNLLQVVGSIKIIKELGLDGKIWTSANTKKYNQALATWGLTTKGTSLSSTARETLEALIKYLGFLYIDPEKIAHITPAGQLLLKEFPLVTKPENRRKLKESEKFYNINFSQVVKLQLSKLTLGNPNIEERLMNKETSLKPFVEMLRYLTDAEINHLTREEVAMFVFFQDTPEEFGLVKEKILEFRKSSNIDQKKTIGNFVATYIGNKTLGESSATIKYWEGVIKMTGMFEESIGFKLNKEAINESKKIIEEYEYPEPEMFADILTWWEYYGNPTIIRYPRRLSITLPNLVAFKLLLTYFPKADGFLNYCFPKLKVDGDTSLKLLVFPNVNYEINLKILAGSGMREISFDESYKFEKNQYFIETENNVKISLTPIKATNYKEDLLLLCNESKLSSRYLTSVEQLLVLMGIETSTQKAKDYIAKRMASIKGGRFEKLFFDLLKEKEDGKVIDKVVEWRGVERNGLYYPSPAGLGYQTDIEFVVGKYHFGLELTTAGGRTQWKTEAESVTDHVQNLKAHFVDDKDKVVVGLFTAPFVTEFMKAICFYFSKFVYDMPIIAISSKELFDMCEGSKDKKDFLRRISTYNKTIFGAELPQ